jgi:beta-galactosidase
VSQLMDRLMATDLVGDRLLEPGSLLDVVGLNYGDARYGVDKEAHPDRVYVGSESFPTKIDRLWEVITENDNVIGDFTWTAWDLLGEVGTGRHVYPEDAQDHRAPYPWLLAVCGDIDITGRRKPISHYREIVFGLTRTPYIAVRAPREDGYVIEPKAWTWSDVHPTWTWKVPTGTGMHLEAYAAADVVEFRLNGTIAATVPVGTTRSFVAETEIPYEPGTVEAVAFQDGQEVGRTEIVTAGSASRIQLLADRSEVLAHPDALTHVDVSLIDDAGVVNPTGDRDITLTLTGPATLQGFGSANPATEQSYLGSTFATFNGRAFAVLRSTGEAGLITLTATAEGLPEAGLTIEALDR